jgi:hypothetical protein
MNFREIVEARVGNDWHKLTKKEIVNMCFDKIDRMVESGFKFRTIEDILYEEGFDIIPDSLSRIYGQIKRRKIANDKILENQKEVKK